LLKKAKKGLTILAAFQKTGHNLSIQAHTSSSLVFCLTGDSFNILYVKKKNIIVERVYEPCSGNKIMFRNLQNWTQACSLA
jgi:hypothetical protein